MKKLFIIILCFIMLTGCKLTKSPTDIKIEEAKIVICRSLIDEKSAEFRNVFVSPTTPKYGYTVCGEVNAKNRMGGYTGYERFIYMSCGILYFEEHPELDASPEVWAMSFPIFWNDKCENKNIESY